MKVEGQGISNRSNASSMATRNSNKDLGQSTNPNKDLSLSTLPENVLRSEEHLSNNGNNNNYKVSYLHSSSSSLKSKVDEHRKDEEHKIRKRLHKRLESNRSEKSLNKNNALDETNNRNNSYSSTNGHKSYHSRNRSNLKESSLSRPNTSSSKSSNCSSSSSFSGVSSLSESASLRTARYLATQWKSRATQWSTTRPKTAPATSISQSSLLSSNSLKLLYQERGQIEDESHTSFIEQKEQSQPQKSSSATTNVKQEQEQKNQLLHFPPRPKSSRQLASSSLQRDHSEDSSTFDAATVERLGHTKKMTKLWGKRYIASSDEESDGTEETPAPSSPSFPDYNTSITAKSTSMTISTTNNNYYIDDDVKETTEPSPSSKSIYSLETVKCKTTDKKKRERRLSSDTSIDASTLASIIQDPDETVVVESVTESELEHESEEPEQGVEEKKNYHGIEKTAHSFQFALKPSANKLNNFNSCSNNNNNNNSNNEKKKEEEAGVDTDALNAITAETTTSKQILSPSPPITETRPVHVSNEQNEQNEEQQQQQRNERTKQHVVDSNNPNLNQMHSNKFVILQTVPEEKLTSGGTSIGSSAASDEGVYNADMKDLSESSYSRSQQQSLSWDNTSSSYITDELSFAQTSCDDFELDDNNHNNSTRLKSQILLSYDSIYQGKFKPEQDQRFKSHSLFSYDSVNEEKLNSTYPQEKQQTVTPIIENVTFHFSLLTSMSHAPPCGAYHYLDSTSGGNEISMAQLELKSKLLHSIMSYFSTVVKHDGENGILQMEKEIPSACNSRMVIPLDCQPFPVHVNRDGKIGCCWW